jgi:L-amino acid N-acyltransferase YncA
VRDTPISFELEPPGVAEMARRIEATLASFPWLVAEDAQGLLGYAYASRHRERAAYRFAVDVSAYVAERARRRGVGRLLYRRLIAILRAQGFVTAWAGITLPNVASVGLHEAVGFTPMAVYRSVGFKLERWHDVGWWRLALIDPPPAEPVEPVLLPTLRGGDAVSE